MPSSSRKTIFPLAFLICAVVFVFYLNGVWAPFIFDDYGYIVVNHSIRHLWPLWDVIAPPHAHTRTEDYVWDHYMATYAGRPLINLSLAVNYALDGMAFAGFHLWNIAVHMAATLALFGIVRRTLLLPRFQPRFGVHAGGLAAAIALLWAVHPLQTESVTYILQRAESMAGLFYLLTLYCFIRGAEIGAARVWFPLSVLACLAGAGCKETIVTSPVIVWLYDGIFLSPGFQAAWRRRWKVYLSLVSTWILLGYLEWDLASYGGLEGFHHGMSTWSYLPIQCWAIVHYLKLIFWPHPLILDYGWAKIETLRRVWPQALILTFFIAASAWGVWRRSPLGFLGAWFFIILSPSSSIVPIPTQTVAEHRIYLSLAAMSVLIVLGGFLWMEKRSRLVYWMVIIGLIGELGFATIRRNAQYQNPAELWKYTAAHFPNNARVYYSLGHSYEMQEKTEEAAVYFRKAVEMEPGFDLAHYSLAQMLTRKGENEEAMKEFKETILLSPENVPAKTCMAELLYLLHRPAEALPYCKDALRLTPSDKHLQSLERSIETAMQAKKAP